MASSNKPEFPPLLAPGLYPMTLEEVRKLCVNAFPSSRTRPEIMVGLESVVGKLTQTGIVAEVWIDGSFLTEKTDPVDADIVLRVQGEVYDRGSSGQRAVLDWVQRVDLKPSYHCDSYVFYEYPEGHPLYWEGEYLRAYWIKQFGFSRGDEFKGLAVIKVP